MTRVDVGVPAGIGDVTSEWLTGALRAGQSIPAATTVTAVRAERIAQDSGFSSLLYRLHLEGSGVPPTVIVKLPATSEARGAMEMLGGYRRELSFYQEVADRAPISAPRVYVAEMVDGTADFVLVMEDLGDWENADHLAGLSMDRAQAVISQLAGLHGWSVNPANADVLDLFPSIDTPLARDLFLPVFAVGWQTYLDHATEPVPPAVARYAEQFAEHAPKALDALSERTMLLHGDIRADNLFFSGDRMKVVDFQFASGGVGASDIGYLVSQGLPTDLRRGHDEELVRYYLDELASCGVTDYEFDDAWRHYRFAVGYLMVLPVITLIGWDAMPERSRALCLKLTERAVATIDDIDVLEVFA